MKTLTKRITALLLLCAAAVSFCACNEGAGAGSLNIMLTDETSITVSEESSDSAEKTESEATKEESVSAISETETSGEKANPLVIEYAPGVIDSDDKNVVTAAELTTLFIDCVYNRKDVLGRSDLVGNTYLNEYLDVLIKWYYYDKKYVTSMVRAEIGLREEQHTISEDGIEYITFWVIFYSGGGSISTSAQVGIRDGKVVNFILWHSMINLDFLWNSDISYDMSTHSFDISKYPNYWDNDKLAERILKTFKLYYSGEYDDPQAAWDSLGEYNG